MFPAAGLLAGGGGTSINPSQTTSSENKATQGTSASFGDFNVGGGAGSGLKFNTMTLGIAAVVLIAFFFFRRGR